MEKSIKEELDNFRADIYAMLESIVNKYVEKHPKLKKEWNKDKE